MKVYLKNIKQTTSYLYTENQYFRWPALVEEFLAHWKTMRQGRPGPIHWFAVTNSSDELVERNRQIDERINGIHQMPVLVMVHLIRIVCLNY